MKVKTFRSILQAGTIIAITLLVSLAIVLVVQFVELKNAEERLEDLTSGSGSYSIVIVEEGKL